MEGITSKGTSHTTVDKEPSSNSPLPRLENIAPKASRLPSGQSTTAPSIRAMFSSTVAGNVEDALVAEQIVQLVLAGDALHQVVVIEMVEQIGLRDQHVLADAARSSSTTNKAP